MTKMMSQKCHTFCQNNKQKLYKEMYFNNL